MNFKSLARVARSFRLEYGEFKATGAPAVIVAVTGLVLAAGTVRILREAGPLVPETLREIRALAELRAAQRRHPSLES